MIGGPQTAKTEKTPDLTDFNQLPANTSQAAQDILIPYFAGIQRIKTIWVTPALNVVTQEVQRSGGGGGKGQGGSGGSGQFKYFADLVSIVAMGPADMLRLVIIDNTLAFSGTLFAAPGTEYADIGLGQWGSMRISWGTALQNPPAYSNYGALVFGGQRGKVRAEFKQLYFGSVGRTSIPSVELVIERYPDVPGYAHGDARIVRHFSGVNPIAIIYEIMTNVRYGLGIPASKFDISYIQGRINALADAFVFISPLIDSQQPVRSVIQDLCQYFDGFVRKVNGLIQIGYYTHSSNNGVGAPSLNFDSFLPPGVKFKPVGYSGTINEVMMTSKNSVNYFLPNTLRAADTASRLITGQARNAQIDRPYLVDPGIAKAFVEEFLRFNSNPLVTGSGEVKKEAMYSLNVGDLALIQAGDLGVQVPCRITSKTWGEDKSGSCSIEFEQERGSYDSAYSAAKEYKDPTPYVNPAQITRCLIVQLPTALRTINDIEVAILAERNSPLDFGFIPWISDDNILFDSTHQGCAFAVRGTMSGTASGSVPPDVLDTVGFTVIMSGIDTPNVFAMTHAQAVANTMLIFVDREIMSLQGVTALGLGKYRITAIRGRFGSLVKPHSAGAQVWFQNRRALVAISWGPFNLGETFWFKLQAFTHFSVFDLSSASTFAFTIGHINASLAGPTNFVVGSDPTDTYVIFNWVNDRSPGVLGYELRYGIQGGNWQQATKVIDGISSSHSVTLIVPPGDWTFYVTDYDQFFNYSPNILSYNFSTQKLFTLVERNYGSPQHSVDLSLGAQIDLNYGLPDSVLTDCFVHPTAYVLVPIDQAAASFVPPGGTGFETFDQFVVSPPLECSWLSPVLDSKGSGTNIRSSIAVYEYLWGFSGLPSSGSEFLFSLNPGWDIPNTTIVNGYVHPIQGVVVPTSTRLASYVPSGGTGFETFDNFVLDPFPTTTVSFVQETGSVPDPVNFSMSASAQPGPPTDISPLSSQSISYSGDGVTYVESVFGVGTISGTAITRFILYQIELDNSSDVGFIDYMSVSATVAPPSYWTAISGQMRSSPDGITFGPFMGFSSSNFISEQFIQFSVAWDPYGGEWPAGVSSIWVLLDAPSSVQRGVSETVPIGGRTFTFDPPYRQQLPTVHITSVSSTAQFPIITAQSLISFTVRVFNQAGTDTGGIINWIAEGI